MAPHTARAVHFCQSLAGRALGVRVAHSASAPGCWFWHDSNELVMPERCSLLTFPRHVDARGVLSVVDFSLLPFEPARMFLVSASSQVVIRGLHAHRQTQQVLMAVHGSLTCMISDGNRQISLRLSASSNGLYMGPMVWGSQSQFSADAVLLVLADREYEPDDYIHDYDSFRRELRIDE